MLRKVRELIFLMFWMFWIVCCEIWPGSDSVFKSVGLNIWAWLAFYFREFNVFWPKKRCLLLLTVPLIYCFSHFRLWKLCHDQSGTKTKHQYSETMKHYICVTLLLLHSQCFKLVLSHVSRVWALEFSCNKSDFCSQFFLVQLELQLHPG